MLQIAYYISCHGLGHAARSCEVMRALGDRAHFVIKSMVEPWFFEQALSCSYELIREPQEGGCHQVNAFRIDWQATFQTALAIERDSAAWIDREAQYLKGANIAAVISDVASLPLQAAEQAGVPSFMITNFTWADIFEPHQALHDEAHALVDSLKRRYARVSTLFRTPFALQMDYVPRQEPAPLVTRTGRNQRSQLIKRHGLDPCRPIYLIYVGSWGLRQMQWFRLADLAWAQFVMIGDPVENQPENLYVLPRGSFAHEDLTASVDGVIAKPGYGVCGECVANRVPILYCERPEFAEFAAIDRDMRAWGGAIRIAPRSLQAFEIESELSALSTLAIDPDAIPIHGASWLAEEMRLRLGLWEDSRP